MSCKMDQDWEGSYVYKQDCVQWTDLVTLREKFNSLWDLLKKEDRQNNVKYGYSTDEEENAKEQTRHDLATINGFVSVRFNEAGDYDEIYFRITSGTILERLAGLGSQYSYDNQVGGQSANFGPWIVYLKDPCYGCTGFRFQNADIVYTRSISCNSYDGVYNINSFPNIDIDPPEWKAQCIWRLDGGCDTSRGATPISDWQQYCHFNFDWRSDPYYRTKFGDVASKLFAKTICAPVGKPCTVSRNYCCDEYALAHYTEEFMDHWSCPENETFIDPNLGKNTPLGQLPYRMRRLKWVSLGVTLTNPQDEQQPFDDETFFCCNNSITGGVFEGHVTQKISAIHLTNIWDRVNSMVGGKTLRTCEKEKCQFDPENPKEKDKWHFKATVPMYVEGGGTPDILDRKIPDQSPPSPCQNCDRVDVGDPICACNFNDVNHLLDEYLQTCECSSGNYMYVKDEEYRTLSIYGPISDCGCCCSGSTPWINTVSISQSCTSYSCGELPCNSTKAVYGNEGNCVGAAQICSPNWADLTPAEKCAAKRYLTITTVDNSGGETHGRTAVKQYTIDPEGACDSETTCSGSSTTTVESASEYTSSGSSIICTSSFDTTETTVRTFNSDCTYEDETTCSGTSSYDVEAGNCMDYGCEATYNADCTWDGSTYLEGPNQNGSGCVTSTSSFSGSEFPCGPCDGATIESTTEVSPEPNCSITVTYSGESKQAFCSPKTFPSFPAFTKCTPEGEEPPEPPELQPGQGYGGTAYNFVDKNNSSVKSEQKFKYRIEHYVPPTCYLKVWVTKVTQKWKQVDYCTEYETTTDANGCTTTKEVKGEECSYDETKWPNPCNGCCNLWVKDGDPTESDTTYIFSGGTPPCLKDTEKDRYACENIEYGNEVTVTASENTDVYVYVKKFSYDANHEPNDPAGKLCPQATWLQGCKQNGCPVPEWERDSSKCPKCSDYPEPKCP